MIEAEKIALTADQVEEIKNRPMLPSVIISTKPSWIPGPPTQPGWCWIKHVKFNYAGCKEKPFIVWVGKITEDQVFMSNGHDWTSKEFIAAHSPIQEPEDA